MLSCVPSVLARIQGLRVETLVNIPGQWLVLHTREGSSSLVAGVAAPQLVTPTWVFLAHHMA